MIHKSGCGSGGECGTGNVNSPSTHLSISRRGYADSKLILYLTDGDHQFEYEVRPKLPVIDGLWHHAAATVDFTAKSGRLYIDGQLNNEVAIPGYDFVSVGYDLGSYNSNDVFLGVASNGRNAPAASSSNPAGGQALFGDAIDEIYVYDGVLTAQEVSKLCQADAPSGHSCALP